jgi:hypothetical protein
MPSLPGLLSITEDAHTPFRREYHRVRFWILEFKSGGLVARLGTVMPTVRNYVQTVRKIEKLYAKFLHTVVPPITRLIRPQGNLAIEIPRCQMHYGYGKAIMRPVKKSPRWRVISLLEKLVIGWSASPFRRTNLAYFSRFQQIVNKTLEWMKKWLQHHQCKLMMRRMDRHPQLL